MLKDILNGDLKELEEAIKIDRNSNEKSKMRTGVAYYRGEHDIKDYRLFYFDSNGCVVEDTYRSNIKISHQFHSELVDQKVQYLLGNPIEIETEDEYLKEYLKEYINEDFQENLQSLVEGASNKGYEYLYVYKNSNNKIDFEVADSIGIISIVDEATRQTIGIVRYYDVMVEDTNNTKVKITKAEVWDSNQVTKYTQIKNSTAFEKDKEFTINPQPHVLLEDEEKYLDGGGLGYIPFFRLNNNRYSITDLEPIKSLIDDYDLMACSLSNNLQDFQDAIYVVKGYPGDNLDTLTQNLKSRKTISVDEDGGIDVKTIDIPTEARKVKLDLDKEAIYKFGMGFDNSQIGDGNITNIVIKSRYALLDLKTNKMEIRLRKFLKDVINIILQDINQRYNKLYTFTDINIKIERQGLFNEDSEIANEKIKAETVQVLINNILLVSVDLPKDTILQMLCEIFDLDYEEQKSLLEEQAPYNEPITDPTAPPIEPTTSTEGDGNGTE